MRGHDERSDFLFSYVAPEHRVPKDHPLRTVRQLADAALDRLSPRFAKLYSDIGARRFRRSNCCALWCCRCSTASGASGC